MTIFTNIFRWLTCWLPLWLLGKKVTGIPFNVRCASAKNFDYISSHIREMIKDNPDGWSDFGAVVVSDVGNKDGGMVIGFSPPLRSIIITVSTKGIK